MPNTTISVIVPVYNAMPYLRQALDSILSQSYRDLEILLLNDGSTDGSLDVLREYGRRDARVRVIDKPNEGYGASCNRGIKEARGYWIAIVEPDDWIDEGMYAGMMERASRFPEGSVDIVKTPYWRVIDPDTVDQQVINCSYRGLVRPKAQPFAVKDAPELLKHHPSIWSAVYRKGYLEERGIRFLPIPGAGWADNPFLVETLCQTDRIVYFDKPFYHYREETEAKTRVTAVNSTLLPLLRWQDMADVLDRIGCTEPAVWQAQNERGFTYLDGICAYVPLERDDVLEAAVKMCDRMDPQLVLADTSISPHYRRLFALIEDLDAPALMEPGYALQLVRKGAYFFVNAGPSYTWTMLKRILSNPEKGLRITA